MRVTDDDLRYLLIRRAAPSREGCPSGETLAAAAAGRLDEPRRGSVVDHLGGCRDCAEETIALRALEPWAGSAARHASPGGRSRRPPAWAAWTAAAAVVVLGLWALLPQGDPPPGRVRTQAPPALRSLVAESSPLPRGRAVLRWSDAGPGAVYSVSVLTKDLRPLAQAEGLEHPEYAVSVDALRPVPPGGEIVWSVEARWPEGRRVASPTFLARVD